MNEIEPVAIYDATEPSWQGLSDVRMTMMKNWLRGIGAEPNDTYRVEIFGNDRLFARIFTYDRDEHDRRYCPHDHDHLEHPDDCDVARIDPVDVPIPDMPPVKPAPGAA